MESELMAMIAKRKNVSCVRIAYTYLNSLIGAKVAALNAG